MIYAERETAVNDTLRASETKVNEFVLARKAITEVMDTEAVRTLPRVLGAIPLCSPCALANNGTGVVNFSQFVQALETGN